MIGRYVPDENGNMFKCEQGAWVKHDDYEKLINEWCKLASDSLEREKKLERLEREVEWLREKYYERIGG
jgi:hypothetical protein